jgi:hypothetical protein
MAMMIRATVKDECVPDVEEAVQALFAAIGKAQPPGVRYASYRLADSDTYVIVLELRDEAANPLPAIAEFRDFQENLKKWLAEPAMPERLTTVGEYRSF